MSARHRPRFLSRLFATSTALCLSLVGSVVDASATCFRCRRHPTEIETTVCVGGYLDGSYSCDCVPGCGYA